MDNYRLFLVLTLFFVTWLMYLAWQTDYAPKPVRTPTSATGTPSTTTQSTIDANLPATATVNKDVPPSPSTVSSAPELPTTQAYQPLLRQERITVQTDLLRLEIDTMGGDIRRAHLLKYPVKVETPDDPMRLLNDEMPVLFVAQSGLLPTEYAPSHQSVYRSEKTSYRLAESEDKLEVKLYWQDESRGIKVTKIYTFKRNEYAIQVSHLVENASATPWQARLYGQLQRTDATDAGKNHFVYTYLGAALSSPTSRYEKLTLEDIQKNKLATEKRAGWQHGWVAMIQHYFVSAWIPKAEETFTYYTNFINDGHRYIIGLYGPMQVVAPSSQGTFDFTLFIGPKLQEKLATLAPGLDLTVDYGWFWFIAQPLFWLIQFIHGLIGNWGWSIIILTILIKLAFFHLSATSYRSMANMRRLHPRLMALKERYGDDKVAMNQAMMDLYKKEKVNPLGGCLPILVQIPVFIALYWVLLESVEMRQADFIWWLNDLSSPDRYFVLPLIMGATMLLQNHLNPAPIDPIQQKVMMMLPIVFTVFFAFFPSGLVLYWVVNNVLSIAQQWVITKKIAGDV